jgi:hypothetical protein
LKRGFFNPPGTPVLSVTHDISGCLRPMSKSGPNVCDRVLRRDRKTGLDQQVRNGPSRKRAVVVLEQNPDASLTDTRISAALNLLWGLLWLGGQEGLGLHSTDARHRLKHRYGAVEFVAFRTQIRDHSSVGSC